MKRLDVKVVSTLLELGIVDFATEDVYLAMPPMPTIKYLTYYSSE